MAAFNKTNWSRLAIGGSISTGSKSTKSFYGYWSGESVATIEGAGYFDALIDDIADGDALMAVVGIGGAGLTIRHYTLKVTGGHVVLTRTLDVVAGDQDAIADLVLTAPGDTPASADALRDDLTANVLPPIVAKLNAMLAMMRTAGLLST
jgi:hypothetical protein